MRAVITSLVVFVGLARAYAGIPVPSPEQMRHYKRELDHLEATFRAEQQKNAQFGEHFWRESKLVANRNSPAIITALMLRARTWTDEEGLIFVPLVSLLPRKAALDVLRAYEHSPRDSDRAWARDYITEFETDDIKELVQQHSR